MLDRDLAVLADDLADAIPERREDLETIRLSALAVSETRYAPPTTRVEFPPERRAMIQPWADYLDGLQAGSDVAPPHGTVD